MRVLACNADTGACGEYRILHPARVLRHAGYDVTTDFRGESIYAELGPDNNVTKVRPIDYDVAVFQRPMSRTAAQTISIIKSMGVAVVVELDDDFWAIDRTSSAHAFSSPRENPGENWYYLRQSCAEADIVVVSTQALAEVVGAFAKNVRVIRNYVPESYLDIKPVERENHHVLGWTGTPNTHVGDLESTGSSVARSLETNAWTFHCIGDHETRDVLKLCDDRFAYTPWVRLSEYPRAVVDTIDVGIAPLRMSRFNDSKSYLKCLEYASWGIPFVATPTREYERILRQGAGLRAEQKHDWLKQLNRVMRSADLREELIGKGREVARTMTYEQHAHKWWEVWEQAHKIRMSS